MTTASPNTTLDIGHIRSQFPILEQTIHEKPLVYLDNAATTQKPLSVIQTINDYYRNYNANVHRGVHYLSELATTKFEQARETVKNFIHANDTSEIVFLRGTTEAINLVAQTYGKKHIGEGDEVLITELEHHSNIVPWQLLCEQTGAILKVAPINDKGEVILETYKNLLSEKTKLVAINHISNALGTINPIKEMIELAHLNGTPVLVDGAQAAPHTPIDVQALNCDFYTFSGHKLFGPTGIGVLYGKAALLEEMPPYQGGGEMILKVSFKTGITFQKAPFKFEAGTQHIAGVIGLDAAIRFLLDIGLENIHNYENELLHYATTQINNQPHLNIIGTAKNKISVISIIHKYAHPHDIGTILDYEGIAVRTGHHCAMPVMEHFNIPATTRASFVFYNTFEEVDRLIMALQKVEEVFK